MKLFQEVDLDISIQAVQSQLSFYRVMSHISPPLVLHLTARNRAFSTEQDCLLAFGFSRLSDSGPQSCCLASVVCERSPL